MFEPKGSSKEKRVKKMQERETGDAVTVQLARRVTYSLWRVATDNPTGMDQFSPQKPQFHQP